MAAESLEQRRGQHKRVDFVLVLVLQLPPKSMKKMGTEQLTTYHLGTHTSVSLPTDRKVKVPNPRYNTGSWAGSSAGLVLW